MFTIRPYREQDVIGCGQCFYEGFLTCPIDANDQIFCGITVEEMRAIISVRIENGWNDSNPEKREQWRKIPCKEELPISDEWLGYAVERIRDDNKADLLHRYLKW